MSHNQNSHPTLESQKRVRTTDPVSAADIVPWRQQLAQALRRRGVLVQDARLLNVERIPDDEREPGGAWYRVVTL